MAEIKARPILFSGPMVRALLAGTKTQTRRAIKLQTGDTFDERSLVGAIQERRPVFDKVAGVNVGTESVVIRCPYGAPGDLLYVREAWRVESRCDDIAPRDLVHDWPVDYQAGVWSDLRKEVVRIAGTTASGGKLRPGIHQPRWASRLTLEITDVRIERLLDCSEADARAEGLQVNDQAWMPQYRGADELPWRSEFPRDAYFDLWDHINGKGAAEANPWVWAVSFKVHEENVDAFLAGRAA